MRCHCTPAGGALTASVLLTLYMCWASGSLRAQQEPGSEEPVPDRAVEEEVHRDDGQDENAREREELMRHMRRRAEGTKLYALADEGRQEIALIPEPLFQYSDQPRQIVAATLWGWGKPGRPAALEKVERYGFDRYLYCLASLSAGLIEVEWARDAEWKSEQPGLVLKPLPDGPPPAQSKRGRLTQLKNLARRFSATIHSATNPIEENHQEMRFLPRPICRYEDPTAALLDGAIFGFTTHGTNPDALLAIELYESRPGEPPWKYGLARMTTGGVTVRLDGSEIWDVPFTGNTPARFETWLYFWSLDAPERPK